MFQVGTGLPTSDAQSLTTLTTDGASTNAFFFADLSAAVAGVDTLYSSTSAAGIGLHKYAKSCVGQTCTWTPKGLISLPGIEAMTATVSGSNVTLFATDGSSVFRLTDSTGYNANIVGTFSSILTAGANQSFRGLAFAPVVGGSARRLQPRWPGRRRRLHRVAQIRSARRAQVWQPTPTAISASTLSDFAFWKTHFGEPAGAGAGGGPLAVPEPTSQVATVLMFLFVLPASRRYTSRARHKSQSMRS